MAAAVKERSNNNPISLTPAGESDEERLEFIELMTKNCDEVQQQMLADILEQNKDAEYLRRHGLGGATDRASFKSKVSVVTYDDLQPYIQRIVDGDRSPILSGQPISEFYTSSGTTGGERKLVPIVKDELDRRQLVYDLILPIMKQYVSGLDRGRGLYFVVVKSESKTPGGLMARTVVTSYCKSPQFKSSLQKTLMPYTSPLDAILCPDSQQSMYIQILCALYLRLEVNRAGSVFATGFLHAIHFLQTHWQQLAEDIAAGSLSPSITDPSLHASVAGILRPDPDLAHFIADECSKPSWAGIITRIWPNTKYIDLIITGPMAQYIPILQFYSGGLPIASTMYGSSECYFGINLNPMCPTSEISYLMLPNLGYFEFSPIEGEDEDELVDLAAVELGKDYEVVVTTHSGLYRYRLGDILRVVGFYHSCPKFMFLKRKGVVLSIDSDKTDEAELQRALLRAANVLAPFGISVVEYTSHAWTRTIPGHYIIYWELLWQHEEDEGGLSKAVEGEIMEKCCLEMEEELNSVYRQCRVEGRSIGPLEIRVVRARTFEKLMDYAISEGASISQYKVPRCVNLKPILELLDSRVVSSHFSQALPKWTPNRFQKND